MTPVYDTVQAVRADLNRILLERESTIDLALLALLTRQHFLQVGSPGIAKSMLVEALLRRITGASLFSVALTPDTPIDDLVGPQDLLALADHGRRVRVHRRSIVEAQLVYLDEIGRGNQAIYDKLNRILNERMIDELGMDDVLHLPLHACFATSNTHMLDKSLEALNNRFLLREEVRPIGERASFRRLATHPPSIDDVQATMTLDDLVAAQQAVRAVWGTEEVQEAALDLREALAQEGIDLTPRMWTWSFPLLKAHAWLRGETTTALDDLEILIHAWWSDPKDKPVVQRAILAVANPLCMQALEIEDNAVDLLKTLPKDDDPDFLRVAEGVHVQLRDMLTTLHATIKASKAREANRARAIASFTKIHTLQQQCATQLAARMGLGAVDVGDVLVGT